MITIKNVRTLDDQIIDHTIPSSKDCTIEAKEKLLLLPGTIDPHLCFGSIKGDNHNWDLAISSAIRGGVAAAIEIPTQEMPCHNQTNLNEKKTIIEERLSHLHIPLPYFFYAKADLEEVDGLGRMKPLIKGIAIQLDADQREELDDRWERLFQMAAWEDLPLVLNCWQKTEEAKIEGQYEELLEKAIGYTEKQNARLYVLNVATQRQLDIIQEARKKSLLIYAETTPQYLFQEDQFQADCLWKALREGVIETIGSGYHADEQGPERVLFHGGNFNFLNPIFFLPLLLTARQEGKISMEQLIRATRLNVPDILDLDEVKDSPDAVLVDVEQEERVQRIDKKRSVNLSLKGWPVYTILQGNLFSSPHVGYDLIRT